MTTTLRRESAPRHANFERIVVGPTLFTAIADPTAPLRPRAGVRYAFPDAGVATIGAALSPDGVRDAVARGLAERRPDAVWLRDLPWFVDMWGVRAAGRLERLLSEVVVGTDVEFVSWLEGAAWLTDGSDPSVRRTHGTGRARRAPRTTVRSR